MELPIFFIDTPVITNIVTLVEETSRHIVQVLRMKPKENLQLCDGRGNLFFAEIVDDHRKRCTVKINGKNAVPQKSRQVSVAISLLKNAGRFEWFLEKATEIGVSEIIPLICERTEKQNFKFERMKQIVISAMLQSQQAWLPDLHEPVKINTMIAASGYKTKLVAHCIDEDKKSITDYRGEGSVQVLIGPEGDFTPGEISFAQEHQYQPVTLGSTRLRAETAGVVAATLLAI